MSLGRKVRVGVLAVGLVGALSGCGLNVRYNSKVSDLQKGMPPAITRIYEIDAELNNTLTAREALGSESETMRYFSALKKEYDTLMTRADIHKQKEAYDRRLVQYRGLEALGYLAIPFSLLLMAVGIASIAVHDTEIVAEGIARFTGRTIE